MGVYIKSMEMPKDCRECPMQVYYSSGTTGEQRKALNMAISALQAQEVKQEVKKSGCTYKPDCPWYDGSKCNSPNDHGYHECDYDRGIFPESYEELSKNSPKLDKENGDLQQTCNQLATDTISRQAAIDAVKNMRECCDTNDINDYYDLLHEAFNVLPSAQTESDGKHISGKEQK